MIHSAAIVARGVNAGTLVTGGTTVAPSHSDLVILGANVFLGDQQIICNGELVIHGLKD
ncbi:MAG: hypothetical protein M5U01_15335 [Ardenticatenaceae bacterium]|nr:hypothetical protein [Ardenticatenaceae bacterium]